MTSETWADGQARRIGEAIKRLRGKRSAQWLSDQTDALGHRVSRSTISEIETGRKKSVTTVELSILSWALGVPPVQLMFPSMPDGPAEVIPNVEVTCIDASMWMSGERTFDGAITRLDRDRRPLEAKLENDSAAGRLVMLSRERAEIQSQMAGLLYAVSRLNDNSDQADGFTAQLGRMRERIQLLETELRSIKGAVVDG